MKRLLLGLVLACAVAGPVTAAGAAPTPAATAAGATSAQEPPVAGLSKPIPYKKEESGTIAAGQSLAVMAVLLVLAWGGLLLVKRYFPHARIRLPLTPLGLHTARRLQLIETMRLGPKFTLYLVQLDQKTLLLAQSGDNITVAAIEAGAGWIDDKEHQVAKSL